MADLGGAIGLLHELPGGIALWLLDLDCYATGVNIEDLHDAETDRARAFRFVRDRSRYLAGRHALRRLLADELGIAPVEVRLTAGAFGKPMLAPDAGKLQFNVSHSGHLAVIALSKFAPIGVDIELVDAIADVDSLAEAHFTFDERQALAKMPVVLRDRAFLQTWTRKEACLKAVGVGLTVDPRHVHAGCETACRKVMIPFRAGQVETIVRTLELRGIADTIAAVAIASADAGSAVELCAEFP